MSPTSITGEFQFVKTGGGHISFTSLKPMCRNCFRYDKEGYSHNEEGNNVARIN